ncbi:hypothetical protein [Chitinophaga niabensis]|uniref:Uncharacterized protein n=1 Tax=Chitinophaga niabensis TaxID=536979 RepID=A0A1N6D9X8_9BACT|nr:hypothetical protein [Chitinophaga niabensis]SIN67588.1 hypothetical protein SAMN04488055_0518 [Chitinophaga niabensis]
MARQTGPVTFTGKLGNLIGYEVDGVHLLRSMPAHVERSYATKRSALDFGTASKGGRLLRNALSGELEIPDDGKLVNRINKVLQAIVKADAHHFPGQRRILTRHLPALTGFNLNSTTKLDQLLTFQPVLTKDKDGNICVSVNPAFKKTKGTTHLEIKAIVTGIDFAKAKYTAAVSESKLIDVRALPEKVAFVLPYAEKETAFVVLQVIPFQMVNGELALLEDVKHLAADIIGVLLPDKTLSVEVHYKPATRSASPLRKQPRSSKKKPPPLE